MPTSFGLSMLNAVLVSVTSAQWGRRVTALRVTTRNQDKPSLRVDCLCPPLLLCCIASLVHS